MSNPTDGVVFTPLDTANATLEHIKYMATTANKAMHLPIPSVGDYFAPVRPGQVAGILAQTSNYKSSLIRMIERRAAAQILESDPAGRSVIFHVSTEEDIEELGISSLSASSTLKPEELAVGKYKDWDELVKVALHEIGGLPIFRIGLSLTKESWSYENMYLTSIFRAIEESKLEVGFDIAGIFIDYLQALPFDPELRGRADQHQRRLQVRTDAYRIREGATHFNCPMWVALQAKQDLGGALSNHIQIPGQYDIHESSDVAQRFDRIFSIWLPKQTHPVGKTINFGSTKLVVEEDMLFLRVLKQRGRLPSGRVWICKVNYETEEIYPDATIFDNN